jgi:polysaccharide biosynthesis/export protein
MRHARSGKTRGCRICIRQIRGTRELFHEAVLFQTVCDAGDDFGGRFRPNTGTTRNPHSTSELGGNTCCRTTAVSGAVGYTAASANTAPAETNIPASGNRGGPIDPERYVIGAEDSLQITVWREPTLSGTIPVRPDGMISMVLVGDLRAAGMTPMALGADISQRLKKYIQDPVVTVVVLGVNSQRIFTVGEVNHVGPLMMTPGMTVLQAIVSAGGLSQFANSKHIYILRTVNGKEQKLPFNYKQALKGDNQGITLIPGDTIVVP